MVGRTTDHAFFTRASLSVRAAPSYTRSMVSTLLVIALFAVVGGAVHLLETVGKAEKEPPAENKAVLRVDLSDRD